MKGRGIGSRFQTLSLGVVAALCCQAELPPEKQKWFEGHSAHFLFVTDGSENATQERAHSFETLHEILKVISPDLRQGRTRSDSKLPSFVYLFSSAKGFQSYCEQFGIDGYFVTHLDGNYIAMDSSTPKSTEIAYHEYLHQFMGANFPGVPIWLNEGLACFFQTMQLDGREIVLGRPPDGYLPILASKGLLPISRVLAVSHQSPEYNAGPDRSRFYACAWLLTDYLMTGGDEKRAQLGRYLDLIRSGQPLEECYQRAFGCAPEVLDKELQEYMFVLERRKTIATWNIQFKNLQTDPFFSFKGLSRADALGRLGLLLMSNDRLFLERSKEHLAAALSLDPLNYAGNLGTGLVSMRDGKLREAAPFFGKASLSRPEDALAHYYAGLSLAARRDTGPGESAAASAEAALSEARAHLIRAVELGCTNPDALPLLSSLVDMTQHASADDVIALEKLCRRLPDCYELKLELAKLCVRASRKDSAHVLLLEVAGQTVDSRSATLARYQLDSMNRTEAESLYRSGMEAFKEKRYPEAVTAIEEAIRLAPDPPQKREYQENLTNMRILIDLRSRPAGKPPRPAKHYLISGLVPLRFFSPNQCKSNTCSQS